jgi:hypothetical protein
VERLINMITLPFLALAVLLFVAFFIGFGIGATLKDPPGESEKSGTNSVKSLPDTIKFKEDQLKYAQQVDGDRGFLDISDWKPSRGPKIKLAKPPDVPIIRPGDKKPLDRINWKPSVDELNDLNILREWRKKRGIDKREGKK